MEPYRLKNIFQYKQLLLLFIITNTFIYRFITDLRKNQIGDPRLKAVAEKLISH